MNTIDDFLTYLESQGHGVTVRQIRALVEADRAETRKMVEQIADEAHNRKLELDMWLYRNSSGTRPDDSGTPRRMTAAEFKADPIAAIRARHDAVEQRREWTSTVVTSDGAQAHADRGELLEALAAIAHAVGVCHEPDEGPCVPGPLARVLEEVNLLVKHAGERFDLERERDEARSRVTELEVLAEELMSERDEALAKLARYEAPGPAVLTVVHTESATGRTIAVIMEKAYRDQHARDVAIVEAVEDEALGRVALEAFIVDSLAPINPDLDESGSYWTTNTMRAARDVRAAILRALKGET